MAREQKYYIISPYGCQAKNSKMMVVISRRLCYNEGNGKSPATRKYSSIKGDCTMIKVGVIGCGTIANSAHIPSYLNCPDAEIKYFCDIIPERAEAAVEKYGCGIAVTDYHDVLADPEVTAVSVVPESFGQ